MRLFTRLLLAGLAATALSAETTLLSPSGQVGASVSVSPAGQLHYAVTFHGNPVVESSPLGINVDGVQLGRGVRLGLPRVTSLDETYATRGNHPTARNHYRAWTFPVHHGASKRDYTVEFRVYDDGVAYRYIVPGQTTQHVDGEDSTWRIIDGAKVWYFERLTPGWKLKSYAGEWLSTDINKLDTATPARVGPVQGTPLVFELPQGRGYAAVTKAALYNYSGMRLEAVGRRTLVANFTEGAAGFDVEGPIVTPWRVTLLAEDLNALVNSDLLENLNPAPDLRDFADTSYIKPGRSVWSWETLGLGSAAVQRDFVNLAAAMQFEYSIIDDGWKDWPQPWETVKSICDDARARQVGVWLWVHSNDIDDPADNYQQMRTYFDQVAAVGAVGLKIDFMNGETKVLVDFETAVLRFAAQRRLMINFHGCHASTGESRTFPNEMTREGIRGIEVNKMKEGPLPASHNAALPFTRFLVGHGDYTPILYTNPGPTSWAHQLATAVAFLSPLQVYAEHPDTLMHAPIIREAFPVFQRIPSVWDETVVLPGSAIGDLAVIARRTGSAWFVAVLNGRNEARDYVLDLSFLPPADFHATVVHDDLSAERVNLVGLNPKADLHDHPTALPFAVERRTASRDHPLTLHLAPGGGAVVALSRP